MPMLPFIIGCLLSATFTQVYSQQLPIKNILWGTPESRIIYIGVANPFVIALPTDKEFSAISANANVRLSQDTIFITAHTIGVTDVMLSTKDGTDTITFDAHYLPQIIPAVLQNKKEGRVVSKKDVVDFARLDANFKNSSDQMSNLLGIIRYKIQLEEKIYEHTGNTFDTDLLAAISNASSGSTMVIQEFYITNKFTGNSVNIVVNTTYRLE